MPKIVRFLVAVLLVLVAIGHALPAASAADGQGYWIVFDDGTVIPFGAATTGGAAIPGLRAPIVGAATAPGKAGLWLVASDGGVFTVGGASFHGSAAALSLASPVVGMAASPTGGGYWLAAADGGVFAYGDARFFGSRAGKLLNAQVAGIAASPSGGGYQLVAADGGVFEFGNAPCYCTHLDDHRAPVVGIAEALGDGYWLVGADGGIFAKGPHRPGPPPGANFHGSAAGLPLRAPVVGMARSPQGAGYWLAAADGGVFSYGDATFHGSVGRSHSGGPSVVAITSTLAVP